jgi:hypothetical protein
MDGPLRTIGVLLVALITGCDEGDDGGLCHDVDCSGHGECAIVSGSWVRCSCDEGFRADGLACVPGAVDGDADIDADVDADADADTDADQDADGDAWDYAAGCAGGATEERWAVSAVVGGELVSYLTGRDCAAPVEVCRGCYVASISPSGQRAIVVRPTAGGARLDDRLGLLDLDPLAAEPTDIGRQGTNPVWLDDDSFYYVGLGDLPCYLGGTTAERVEIRLWVEGSARDAVLGYRPRRSWVTCCLLPSRDGSRLAFQESVEVPCENYSFILSILAIGDPLPDGPFVTDEAGPDFPFALLPAGDGFLVQRFQHGGDPVSRLYAVPFEGWPLPVLSVSLATSMDRALLPGVVQADWPSCASQGRLGPACEYYCRLDTDGRWHRMSLTAREPLEAIDCSAVGAEARITAVWQR